MKKRTLSIIMAALILATTSTTAFAASTGEAPAAAYSVASSANSSRLTFNKTSITLGVGETFDINSNSSTTAYSSADPSIASVKTGGGLVTAKSPGTVVITGVAKDGRTATCKVTVKNAPTSVSLNKTSLTLGVGETYDLNSSFPSGQAAYNVLYTSDNASVASVKSGGGYVTAKKAGTATITATTYNGKKVTCKITVKKAPASVSLNKTSLTLGVGESYDLNSKLPSGTASHSVVYTSDNTSVASVKSAGGYVTAKKAGTATITATTYNGKKVTCKITVKKAPTSVSLNKTSLTLGVGESYDLNSKLPSGTASHSVVYTSDNTSVASVKSAGGYVTANKAGTATITATTFNGKKVTCKITVKKAPTSVNLNKTSLTLGVGETYDLNSSFPSGQASHSVVYTSDNTSVASVKSAGGYVTANKAGTATITATTFNGKKVTCKITVKKAPTSVSLNKTSLTLGIGESYDLNSKLPSGTASNSVVYTSDNTSVASVKSAGGYVTAKKAGTATITATTYNGKKVTCKITVKNAPTSVSLNKTSLSLAIGETFDLNSSFPSGQASHSVVYTSDNPEVASVKAAGGLVTANKAGTATITATTFNGKKVTCTVTVTEMPTDPIDPTDPTTPTEPTNPTNPTDPTEGKTWHEAVYEYIEHPAVTEEVWVVDKEETTEEVPMYEYKGRTICNVCGADITDNLDQHLDNHVLNGEGGSYHNDWVWCYYDTDNWLVENNDAGNMEKVLADDGKYYSIGYLGSETAQKEAWNIINHLILWNEEEYKYNENNTIVYKVVTTPEQGHYETVVIQEAWTEKVLIKEAGWY